ncbi:MAG: hypothetical protein QOJ70_3066 [Acidobacteriota bacterium]|nr:hypothetical protein [Acidobacteriota bacterium]
MRNFPNVTDSTKRLLTEIVSLVNKEGPWVAHQFFCYLILKPSRYRVLREAEV